MKLSKELRTSSNLMVDMNPDLFNSLEINRQNSSNDYQQQPKDGIGNINYSASASVMSGSQMRFSGTLPDNMKGKLYL